MGLCFQSTRNGSLLNSDQTQKIDCRFEPDDDESKDGVRNTYNISRIETEDIARGAR